MCVALSSETHSPGRESFDSTTKESMIDVTTICVTSKGEPSNSQELAVPTDILRCRSVSSFSLKYPFPQVACYFTGPLLSTPGCELIDDLL